ncbi:hypothetical protein [Sulfurimonas sp.]|uniref:hypothetical protein n=1 Tax=Sulfurimonas sp. TaxID=2022749 RepID=UPI0025D8F1F7|nr:hypothetical protein [Sulfurimonas sp.]MCK9454744.1 NYN domain-containing protein [Sulfurimonas sp.]
MFSFFCFESYFQAVDEDVIKEVTWGSGNYREKAVLLWDLENIPYSHLPQVKQSLKFAPERSFIITTNPIKHSKLISMQKNGFEVLVAHKSDSDAKIKSVYRILKEYDEFIFISSDSDFVDIGKKILFERKKLTWIMQDANKKRIAMKMNLCDKNLKLITLSRFEL